jgi:hypothetical protein
MKALALVVALLSVPAFAADYSPWPGREPTPTETEWLELIALTAVGRILIETP